MELEFVAGYKTMLCYLDTIWEQTKSDPLGALLSSMSLLPDGCPIDPAVKDDWNQAVEKAAAQIPNHTLVGELAYRTVLVYLKDWLSIAAIPEIENIYLELLNCEHSEIWEYAVSKAFSS